VPEGDTIHRLAAVIRPDLAGRRLARAELRERGALAALEGRLVERVEARGKHLLVGVDGGWALRTHLGLYGDVHRYSAGERWRRAAERAVLVLGTDLGVVFVWFEPAKAELYPAGLLRAHPMLSRLGPDLVGDPVDLVHLSRRAVRCAALRGAGATIGELLLDQSIACGVGNIYKSEVLFIEGIDPATPATAIDEDTMMRIYQRARTLLRRNLEPGPRTTRRGFGGRGGPSRLRREPRLWVYAREGKPCLRCGEIVRRELQGVQKRATFFCPRCQAATSQLDVAAERALDVAAHADRISMSKREGE
jgi:endonuclease-8